MRERFFNKPFYRLIHAEADFLPGLIIDRFDNIFVCQISTAGMENLKPFLILALKEIFKNCQIIFKNNSELRALEKLESSLDFESVDDVAIPEKITVIENDLEFKIDLKNGQKTGWFFDQAVNRNFVASLVKDCDVFDGFCYVGGFGINAVKAQARSVIFADSSKEALDLTRENCQKIVEKFNPACQTSFYNKKIFDLLEDAEFQKKSFDVILLDPPAFVKNKKDLFSGLRGYEKLAKMALPLLKSGGILMLASCSHHATKEQLIGSVNAALQKSQKTGKLITSFTAGPDHPLHPALKESEYLKSLFFVIN